MVFSSLTFLFAFIPLCMILYFPIRNRYWRNGCLLVMSLLFYSWGEPIHLLLMMLATVVAYVGGLLMDRFRKKSICILTVVLLILNLVIFKYLNFLGENLNRLPGIQYTLPKIALPIGISFYTFQILSYVIDLQRGKVQVQKNFFHLALYVSFFPQLIAGPIVRYETIQEQILYRKETLDDVTAGLKRFIWGLVKKVLLANQIAMIAEIIYAGSTKVYGTAMYWVAALAYTLQIYYDFSGYSDMAIGLGRIFGFRFLENFEYPYKAVSITEFWKRWHISLSSWFRDYVYIPLGGNRTTTGKWIRNILIVWCLTGFWHGAQWNFLFWGFYYAVILLAEKLILHHLLEKMPRILRWCYTMLIVMIGWILFSHNSIGEILRCLKLMFMIRPTDWVSVVAINSDFLRCMLFMPLGIILMFPYPKLLGKIREKQSDVGLVLNHLMYLLLLGVCIIFLLSSTYNPFIYFRF